MATTKRSGAAKGAKPVAKNGRPKRRMGAKPNAAAKPLKPVQWKCHLDSYALSRQRALTFKDRDGIEAAIKLVWTDDLVEMPHALAGGFTMIVPADAVPFFERSGLEFENAEIHSITELSPKEQYELRKENGYFA